MSTVLGLPIASPAPGLASPVPASRAAVREPGPEVGAIRPASAVTDQQGRVASQRSGQPERRSEQGGELLDERAERSRDESGSVAAQGGFRPAAAAGAFLAQLLSQGESRDSGGGVPATLLFGSRQAELGSDAYRRAGGEPPAYSEAPSLFRIAV